MHLSEFSAGDYRQQFQYRSFTPSLIHHAWTWDDPVIHTLLSDANRHLGELDAFSRILPDVDRFIQMHVVKEAQNSSRIEGTKTEMDEALEEDASFISPEKRDDWQEVRNYIAAMNQAMVSLERLPMSMRLLCDTHTHLMRGVRGDRKTPGEFRRSQNWIGGATPVDAVFVPPSHEELPELLSDLEKFWHDDTLNVPDLIRVAISHYQFETIHPFLDGNGRIGRMLITLYLVSKGLLHRPTLYLSAHLEKHRAAYFDSLMRVRTADDMTGWIKFFLVAVKETALTGCQTFREILALKTQAEASVLQLGRRAEAASRLLQLLYQRPIVTSIIVADRLNISQPTADRLLADLEKLGLLREVTGKQRRRQFFFESYYQLFLK